ncbi:MAG: MaoC family dehydratase N-terminal domain-containing protein [Pseudomonadota bacterium]
MGEAQTIQKVADRLDPGRAAALHAALGRSGAAPEVGEALPGFWHHIYFWDVAAPEALGADGHPVRGGLIPDLGLPRRMWAGGRLTFHAPLLCGVRAEKHTSLSSTARKAGRSGALAFVTLRHEIRQRGALVLSEEQDLVYRQADAPAATPPEPPPGGALLATFQFNSTVLFRYSALTMNGHRIHYDADYAREVEGYAGLVVHGPLLAQILVGLAEAALGPLACFSFRATAPVIAGEDVRFYRKEGTFWAVAPGGRLAMTAEARGR